MVNTADVVEMTVPSKAEYVGVVRLTVSGIANRAGFSYDDIEDMKIAVAEACTNVVDHAYSNGGTIKFSCSIEEEGLKLVVSDDGQSVDVVQLREEIGPVDGQDPVGELKEGGLGLFLIESLMDEVEISSEAGVAIVMKKFLQRDGVEENADGPRSADKQKQ
ncbi:anti-sigma B factor RsbW [Salsuginibacillus kocurii]|uniref:anti-sigma B factor RsbW n=1 Tax=Salsuginibacillus kocurii TaxID=427078 RepID=UPI00035E3E58|nr:anti-sigma B factor RsbW [Salsuginibacillus kocurii]